MRRRLRALALGAAIVFAGPSVAEEVTLPAVKPIAVVDFDYRDTSGEPRDQSAEPAGKRERSRDLGCQP